MIYCDLMALENCSQCKNIFHPVTGLALIERQLATSIVWSLNGKHADLTHLTSDIKISLINVLKNVKINARSFA